MTRPLILLSRSPASARDRRHPRRHKDTEHGAGRLAGEVTESGKVTVQTADSGSLQVRRRAAGLRYQRHSGDYLVDVAARRRV